MERLEELKTGKVYLVYDSEKHRMAVEKHLQGRCAIYERLKALPHLYLPKLYEVNLVCKTESKTETNVVNEKEVYGMIDNANGFLEEKGLAPLCI